MTELKKDVPVAASPQSSARRSWLTPFGDLQHEINSLFDRFFNHEQLPLDKDLFRFPARMKMFHLTPNVEVSEKKDKYVITAEIPGVEEKDVSVTVHDGLLTLKGEKRMEEERDEKDVHISERSYGSFERSFVLPDDAAEDTVDAKIKKGVLTLSIAKSAKPKASERKIEIKAG